MYMCQLICHYGMDILEMTDSELYEVGIKELTEQLGPAYTAKFLQQCKPNEYDYSLERHKLLANQPDIPTIVKRIQQREVEREAEERIKAERVAAWRNGLLDLTDIEIYELALEILIDKFSVYGFIRFFQQHFKNLNADQAIDPPQHLPDGDASVMPPSQLHESKPQD